MLKVLRGYFVKAKMAKTFTLSIFEDLVFNKGYEGVKEVLNYLEGLRVMLATGKGDNKHQLTVKWDGAPAIICGIDPADSKFFVGTKSVFSKTPKLIKKPSDTEKLYPDQPELAHKLRLAYKYLSKLGIGAVIQGDFMFDSSSKKIETIDNKTMITFTPNTITYAAQLDSEIGQRIKNAEFGIIFHTEYEGDAIDTMYARFGVDVSGLNRSSKVWFDDASYKDYTGIASLTPDENKEIVAHIDRIANTLNKIKESKMNAVINNKELAQYFKPYVNNLVKQGTLHKSPIDFLKGFVVFVEGKLRAEIAKVSGGPESKAAKSRLEKIEKHKEFIDDNMNSMLGIIAIFYTIVGAKLLILSKLKGIESLGAFIKSDSGYKVTSPEGFVAIGHGGGAVKLVDRLEFSRTNFLSTKTWKKT